GHILSFYGSLLIFTARLFGKRSLRFFGIVLVARRHILHAHFHFAGFGMAENRGRKKFPLAEMLADTKARTDREDQQSHAACKDGTDELHITKITYSYQKNSKCKIKQLGQRICYIILDFFYTFRVAVNFLFQDHSMSIGQALHPVTAASSE